MGWPLLFSHSEQAIWLLRKGKGGVERRGGPFLPRRNVDPPPAFQVPLDLKVFLPEKL